MVHLLRLALLATLAIVPTASAGSFVFDGRLDDLGRPANGRYDLRLGAFSAAEGPWLLSAPVTFTDVAVVDGRFRLEFELPVESGAGVWLEVAVRDAGTPVFTPIAGRSKAHEAPYIGQCWSSIGDAGTNPATHYLGTSDAQPLVLRTYGTRALRIEPSDVLNGGAPITANLLAGSSANSIAAGVRGATIAGGGAPTGTNQAIGPTPNRVTSHYGFVGGGLGNVVGDADVDGGRVAVVSGGLGNAASGYGSVVAGGAYNQASNYLSSVLGGGHVSAVNAFSVGIGGADICAGGEYSWAGGRRARVRPDSLMPHTELGCVGVPGSGDGNGDEGSFMWADAQDADFVSSGPGQFLVRASGGLGLNTSSIGPYGDLVVAARAAAGGGDADADLHLRTRNGQSAAIYLSDSSGGLVFNSSAGLFAFGNSVVAGRYLNTGANGAYLSSGGTWTNGSSRHAKVSVAALDPAQVLARVLALPVTRWRYLGSTEGDHVGPMAEDFHAAFGLGADARSIATVDADGIALAAIQGLAARLDAENALLRGELEELRQRLEAIAAREH